MFGSCHGFKVCTGTCYLGGYIRGVESKTRLADREYADVGEEHQHDQQNRGKISPGELRLSSMFNPTRVEISTTCHLVHGQPVHGSGENDPENLFALSFLRKDENLSPTIGALSTMPVKKSGLGLLNPATLAHEKY